MRLLSVAAALALLAPMSAHAAADANPKLVTESLDEQLRTVWPADALRRRVGGKVVLQCEVTAEGQAENCVVASETPLGEGFARAALTLAPALKFIPAREKGKPVRSSIRVPLWFELPLDTLPDWLRKPSAEDMMATWPAEAARRGLSGEATVQCTISPQGTLEGCEVTWENPPGMGFGNAALLLTPSFLLKPGVRDGKPVSTSVNIPISFKTDGSFSGDRLEMISNPLWAAAPNFADMAAAWPSKAKAAFGHVSMRCGITPEGGLRSCDVLTETPGMQGFGKAAKTLAPKFRLLLNGPLDPKLAKAEINLPIRFTNPAAAEPRVITKPKWITTIDPEKVVSIFPYEAAEAGVKSGRGVADCLVAPNGKLVDCKAAPATPEGLGFSEAAVQIASIMIMNPWSDGGGPVDGVRLRLPVAFNLAPEDELAPAPSAVTYVKDVVWTRKPSGHDMAAVVPEEAIRRGVDGRIVLDCAVASDGYMRDCKVSDEEPTGFGYGAAALKLAPKFRMKAGAAPPGARVKIPIKILAR